MPKGARLIRFAFDESHLTHFGGMWLIQRFCNKLRLRRLIQRYVRVTRRSGTYRPAELILALLYSIIMGLRRFLKRFPPKNIRQVARLHDSLRAQLFALPHERNSLVFDLDSTVLIIYGHAEGARIGYNP